MAAKVRKCKYYKLCTEGSEVAVEKQKGHHATSPRGQPQYRTTGIIIFLRHLPPKSCKGIVEAAQDQVEVSNKALSRRKDSALC